MVLTKGLAIDAKLAAEAEPVFGRLGPEFPGGRLPDSVDERPEVAPLRVKVPKRSNRGLTLAPGSGPNWFPPKIKKGGMEANMR